MVTNGIRNIVFTDGISVKVFYEIRVFYFQQDYNPKHTAIIVKEWLLYNTSQRSYQPYHTVSIPEVMSTFSEILCI
ncbi:putative mediator of RNA polymerase II transcription subunit 17 [Vespula maculifrons]|uniref:Mediator of RNA polymerase II transcription subunit 17 n=1 Tax=Vespula maculifrons TaxID=7453 RepID=A0ABD2CW64_VESMC